MKSAVAWAAGLFEGEGSFSFAPGRPGGAVAGFPVARLSMTDFDVVRRFGEILGFGTFAHKKLQPPNQKPQLVWQTGRFEKVQFLVCLFWPYFGDRRRARAVEVLKLSAKLRDKYKPGPKPRSPNP